MKQFFAALLAVLMAAALCACGAQDDADHGAQEPETGYDDALLGELYSTEGEYTDENGNTLRYSYHVPQLKSETATAAALNAEIADACGALVQEQLELMDARASLTCLSVSWESCWNGSLVCLVVKRVMDADCEDYAVYSYDYFGGRRLTSEDLIARCGMEAAEFTAVARRTAARRFDALYREQLANYSGGAEFIAAYAERRAWTLSDENINAQMKLFLKDGALRMIVPVGSFAGADSYEEVLTLDTSAQKLPEKEAQDRFVRVSLSDGALRVRFEETEESAWYAENFRFDYETVYFAEGLYADYADVFVGSVGQGYFPYVFLLTEDGTVEYVNLLEGLTAGFLCCGGPLGGVSGIVSFEAGEVEEEYGSYQTVFAVDGAGKKHDLAGPVSDADYTVPAGFTGTWTAEVSHDTAEQGSYMGAYVLAIGDGGGVTLQDINTESHVYYEYSGQINYLGTNGEGMVFGYHLNEMGGSVRFGAFTLLHGENDTLRVKIVTGENLFDAPVGRATVFERSFW